MDKPNCWEFMRCGREPGGTKVAHLGVCPASTEARLDGTHHGKNSGRACWAVAGTLCKGQVQGTFAKKYRQCQQCEFYMKVRKDEFPQFVLVPTLLSKLDEERSPQAVAATPSGAPSAGEGKGKGGARAPSPLHGMRPRVKR